MAENLISSYSSLETFAEQDKENILQVEMKTSRKGTPLLSSSNGRMKAQFKIMSDDEIAASMGKFDDGMAAASPKVKTAKRRSLAPLQQSVDGKDILTGYGRNISTIKDVMLPEKDCQQSTTDKRKQNSNNTHSFNHVKEEPCFSELNEVETKERKVEDPLIEDALDLITSTETVGEGYWKSMAEERRFALEETLFENDKLYDRIGHLEMENDRLRRSLSELECFKMLYHSLQDKIVPEET